jgi:hypothetical protein
MASLTHIQEQVVDITAILDGAHSGFRWIVLIAAAVALIINLVALFQQRAGDDKLVKNGMRFWTISLDIQWLLGLLLIIVQWIAVVGFGNTPAYVWEHAIGNTLAVVVAHSYMAFRKRPGRTPIVGNLITIVIALVILILTITLIPGGWSMGS